MTIEHGSSSRTGLWPRVLGAVVVVAAASGLAACSHAATTSSGPTATAASSGFAPGMKYSKVLADFVGCMDVAGWKVKVDWGGGFSGVGDVPQAQLSVWQKASDACIASTKLGTIGNFAKWTPEQVKRLYGQEVATHECFVKHGWNSAEPPSEQQFIDTFATKDQYYGMMPAVNTGGSATLETMSKACPPPTWFPDGVGF
jgi:hypothetical protein